MEFIGYLVVFVVLIDEEEAKDDGGDDEEVEEEEDIKFLVLHKIHQNPWHYSTHCHSNESDKYLISTLFKLTDIPFPVNPRHQHFEQVHHSITC